MDQRMNETTRMLLMTLERTLATLDLALCDALRPSDPYETDTAGTNAPDLSGRAQRRRAEASHRKTIVHLVHAIDGLVALLEREGHPLHVALTSDDQALRSTFASLDPDDAPRIPSLATL